MDVGIEEEKVFDVRMFTSKSVIADELKQQSSCMYRFLIVKEKCSDRN